MMKPAINCALIGSGWALKTQKVAFEKAGINVVAMWTYSPERAKKVAEEHKIHGNIIYF